MRGQSQTVEPGGHHRRALAEIEDRQDQQQVEADKAQRLHRDKYHEAGAHDPEDEPLGQHPLIHGRVGLPVAEPQEQLRARTTLSQATRPVLVTTSPGNSLCNKVTISGWGTPGIRGAPAAPPSPNTWRTDSMISAPRWAMRAWSPTP